MFIEYRASFLDALAYGVKGVWISSVLYLRYWFLSLHLRPRNIHPSKIPQKPNSARDSASYVRDAVHVHSHCTLLLLGSPRLRQTIRCPD